MHLVSLEVKGLKSLRDTKIEGLEHYSVFVGKNDAGKSAILQAIQLLRHQVPPLDENRARDVMSDTPERGRLRMSMSFELSEADLRAIPGAEKWADQEVLGRIPRWRYDFEMRVGDKNWSGANLYVTGCGPVRGDDYGRLFALADPDAPNEHRKLGQGYVERVLTIADKGIQSQLEALTAEYWFKGKSTPIDARNPPRGQDFYFDFLSQFVERIRFLNPSRAVDDEMRVEERNILEPSGRDLTQVLETWRSSDVVRFRIVRDCVKDLFPDVKDLHLSREMVSTVFRVASGRALQPRESFRLAHVGTGIQQALVVSTAVVSAEEGGIAMLEEPELNLHAGAQRTLANWLRTHALENNKQILLTTHSTIFASTEKHSSTYLVRLDEDKGTQVTRRDVGHQPLVKEELGIRNVDLYGYNGVVLWEGDSEDQAMPLLLEVLAEQAGTSVHALGLTSRNLYGHTNTRLQAVRQFLALLDNLDIAPFVLMDDDEGVREELDKLVEDGLLPEGRYHVWEQGREMHGRNPDAGSEFEDNFSNEQLVAAARGVAKDAGVTKEFDVDEFARRCTETTSKTSEVLRKYYHEVTEYGLSKPDLARKLAELVTPELRGKAERTVKEYEFERVARDIFAKLGG